DTENAFKLGPIIRKIEEGGNHVVKCNLGEPDFPLPEHIREEIKHQLDADNTHYSDPQGIVGLRRAIAGHLSRSRGIKVTPERVVVFPGAKPPIGLCQQTYANPGDEIIYPSPGFPIYESFTRYVGAEPIPLHLREEKGFSLDGEDLAPLISKRTKLIFLNFPSNPTGGVASRSQLAELAEVIERTAPEDVRVYSDEVYEDILFDGAEHHSIASIPGMETRTIIVSGVSKSYSWTGGRLGWAAFPTAEEAQIFKNLNINYFSCMPPYNQEGARVALQSPESRLAIERMVAAFEERRDVVVAGLNAIDGISCQNPRGAFYVFPNIAGVCGALGAIDAWQALPTDLRQNSSPSTLFQRFLLLRYHLATMDRRSFGRIGSEGKHFLRLSIATGMDELKEGLSRIERAVHDRRGFAEFLEEELAGAVVESEAV
ncbi:MAG TPA: aminotransferase class I/II-fold pyridoxal phosphate-dependent enzyme, partial [Thermoanaerobaculia bacterium]|nr:aminotransferase class I/II-fold pyridoxal phosphate-dependent enzyme [Thermoanaerobaculia bacterium]